MKAKSNYIEINKESWNNKVETHLNSDFYDVAGFLQGKSSLNQIELDLLGILRARVFYTCSVILDKIAFR